MLKHDPIPWLMKQDGLSALRARRRLGLDRKGDEQAVRALTGKLRKAQRRDGSFGQSIMKTAGVLNLLDEVAPDNFAKPIERAARYLISILQAQPGYGSAKKVKPGGLEAPLDLCGFFGPYEDRRKPDVMARGAREMNFHREYEPLLGPKAPVRARARSSYDRPGPSSCFAWGLMPLAYVTEALCRAGYGRDRNVKPAINVLLGAQRESGGWCRNLSGHPACSLHAIRALGAHPTLRRSRHIEHALAFLRAAQRGERGGPAQTWWARTGAFAGLQAVAAFRSPIAREILREGLTALAPRQRKNGSFGTPCPVERVAAVLAAVEAIGEDKSDEQ